MILRIQYLCQLVIDWPLLPFRSRFPSQRMHFAMVVAFICINAKTFSSSQSHHYSLNVAQHLLCRNVNSEHGFSCEHSATMWMSNRCSRYMLRNTLSRVTSRAFENDYDDDDNKRRVSEKKTHTRGAYGSVPHSIHTQHTHGVVNSCVWSFPICMPMS